MKRHSVKRESIVNLHDVEEIMMASNDMDEDNIIGEAVMRFA
jgi:hypothetical protein